MESELIKIDVARLAVNGENFAGKVDGTHLDLELPMLESAGVVTYQLHAIKVGLRLLVRGKVNANVSAVCARCGVLFPLVVEDKEFEREYETLEDQIFVDLTPDVRETILLAFPAFPLCGEECKGVCPSCGRNLNKQECICRGPAPDVRWGPLDDLRIKEE